MIEDYSNNGNSGGGSGSGGGGSNWWSGLGNIVFGDNSSSNNNNNNNNNNSSGSWLEWARFLSGIQQANRDPKFTNAPLTPQQQKLWDLYYGSLTNPAFKDNAGIVQNYAIEQLNGLHPTWDSPKTSTGETGYGGSSPQHSALPAFDWNSFHAGQSAYGTGGGSGSGGSGGKGSGGGTGGGGTTGSGATGVGGDPFSSITSPAGTTGDPFAGMDTAASHDTDFSGINSIADVVNRYGKPTAQIVSGIMAANPWMTAAGVMGYLQGYRNGGNNNNRTPPPPGGHINPIKLTDDQWGKGTGNVRTPVQTPGNTVFDPMHFGDQSPFNHNLANDPGQFGGSGNGGMTGFGYGQSYDDSMPNRHGRRGGLV